jgi:hypothetical protein
MAVAAILKGTPAAVLERCRPDGGILSSAERMMRRDGRPVPAMDILVIAGLVKAGGVSSRNHRNGQSNQMSLIPLTDMEV